MSTLNLDELMDVTETDAEEVTETGAEEVTETGAEEVTETGTEATTEEVVAEPQIDTLTVIELINLNLDKLVNCEKVEIREIAGQSGFALFHKIDTSELVLLSDLDKLVIESGDPQAINIVKSGVIVNFENRRSYVTKGNTVEFHLDDNFVPTKCVTLKKKPAKGAIPVEECLKEINEEPRELEYVQMKVATIASSMPDVESAESIEVLRTAVLSFMGTIKDINYLVKIEKQLLMTTF